jgi:hypothetical protein
MACNVPSNNISRLNTAGPATSFIMKRLLSLIALAVVSMLLNSCLDGKEEYWFEANGSGRIESEYRLPGFAIASMGGEAELRSKIEAFFEKEPSITLVKLDIAAQGTQTILHVEAQFDSIKDFAKLFESKATVGDEEKADDLPEPLKNLLGDFHIKRQGLTIHFDRLITPSKLFGQGLLAPSAKQLEGHQLQYIMHLPTLPTEHNAHQVSNDGKTLVWNFALQDAMKQPIKTNFRTPIPLPWWIWPLLALIIFACGWLLRRLLSLRKKSA